MSTETEKVYKYTPVKIGDRIELSIMGDHGACYTQTVSVSDADIRPESTVTQYAAVAFVHWAKGIVAIPGNSYKIIQICLNKVPVIF